MTSHYCPHCSPTRRKSHALLHIEYYLEKLTFPFAVFIKKLSALLPSSDRMSIILFELLAKVGLVKFESEIDESKFHNRSLIFFKEAKRRGLDVRAVKLFGNYVNEFRLVHGGKKHYYEAIPLTVLGTATDWDDKQKLKKLLLQHGLPVAQGRSFTRAKQAMEYGKRLGYPLVIKPVSGSLSHHCTRAIQSEAELAEAILVAKQYRPDFVVEQHVEGNVYRATVVGQSKVFVCQKERAHVVGDGQSTIQQLIELKNNHPDRGEAHQRNTSLHKITDSLSVDISSVLEAGHIVYLQDKYVLGLGCDIINVGHAVHADNHQLFLRVAQLLDAPVVGIDFICSDIARSHVEQQAAILETNSLPYIDMHQYPSAGQPEPVAEIVWDLTLNSLTESVRTE